jgi:hypothetical protein
MGLIRRIENGTTTYIDAKMVRIYIIISLCSGFLAGLIVGFKW